MSVTKKYKKGRNNRRKTRILLKKKFRRTRKKMIGGSNPTYESICINNDEKPFHTGSFFKKGEGMGASNKFMELSIRKKNNEAYICMKPKEVTGSITLTTISHKTTVEQTDNGNNYYMTINPMKTARSRDSGRKTTFYTDNKDKRNSFVKMLKKIISEKMKKLPPVTYSEIYTFKRPYFKYRSEIENFILVDFGDCLGKAICAYSNSSNNNINNIKYYKYIHELKLTDVKLNIGTQVVDKPKRVKETFDLDISLGFMGKDSIKLLPHENNDNDLQKFYENIIKEIQDPEIDIHCLLKKFKQEFSTHYNAVINDPFILNIISGASAVVGTVEILHETADNSQIPVIGIATLAISLIAKAAANVFETERKVKESIQQVSQIWSNIIDPLQKIIQAEKENNDAKITFDIDSLLQGLKKSIEHLLRQILIYKINIGDIKSGAQEQKITETTAESIVQWTKIQGAGLLDKFHNTIGPISRHVTTNVSDSFNFMLKMKKSMFIKQKIQDICDSIQQELTFLMQVINLKTNYNTLELLGQTKALTEKTKVHEDLVNEKDTLKAEMQLSSKWTEHAIQDKLRSLEEKLRSSEEKK